MDEARSRSISPAVALLAAVSLVPLAAALRLPVFLNDDAYITFTYARSLAEGRGFVFNQPPAALGTTTPFFTLLLAGLGALLPWEIRDVAVWLTAVCWAGTGWLFFGFRSAWGLTPGQSAALGLAAVACGTTGALGMETYLFAFLLVLGLSLLLAEQWAAAGVATTLLFLTRGEGALLAPVAGSYMAWRLLRPRRPLGYRDFAPCLAYVAGTAVPLAIWIVYALATFGSILPNTLAAKEAQRDSGLWVSFYGKLRDQWAPGWGMALAPPGLPWLSLWWAALAAGIAECAGRCRRPLLLLAWAGLYTAGYVFLGVAGYWWYELPLRFVLHLFVALGLWAAAERLTRTGRFRAAGTTLAALLAAGFLAGVGRPVYRELVRPVDDERGPSYLALARWFERRSEPDDSIAYIEIGYLGYYSGRRIIDLAGLTIPEIVPHVARKDFAWGFWRFEPDYYVHLPAFDWALGRIPSDPRFVGRYRPVDRLAAPGGQMFTIYRRVDRGA